MKIVHINYVNYYVAKIFEWIVGLIYKTKETSIGKYFLFLPNSYRVASIPE